MIIGDVSSQDEYENNKDNSTRYNKFKKLLDENCFIDVISDCCIPSGTIEPI